MIKYKSLYTYLVPGRGQAHVVINDETRARDSLNNTVISIDDCLYKIIAVEYFPVPTITEGDKIGLLVEPVLDMKKLILDNIQDLVSSFLYYDRKEDEDLPSGAIENAIEDGIITKEDIVNKFSVILDGHL